MKYVNNWDEMEFPLGVTIFGTIVFVAYYTYLSLHGGVPQENSIEIFGKEIWKLETPISYWWEILTSPLIVILIINYYGSKEYLPWGNKNHSTIDKHEGREHVRESRGISLGCAIGMQIVFVVIFPIINKGLVMGPITSGLSWGVSGFIICYSFFGFIFGLSSILETDKQRRTSDEPRNVKERFISFILRYSKMGILKTLPMLFGLIAGYLALNIYKFIAKIFKGIGYAFKKEKTVA